MKDLFIINKKIAFGGSSTCDRKGSLGAGSAPTPISNCYFPHGTTCGGSQASSYCTSIEVERYVEQKIKRKIEENAHGVKDNF